MALPVNALTLISGDTTDNPIQPIFTNSDISGDFGAGLLMDLDFADPDGAGSYAGAFAAGDLVVNSAWEHVVRRLIPTATRDSLSSVIGRVGASNQITVERTAKGYPHVVVSQVNDTTTTVFFFSIPTDIVTYLIANPTHQYRPAIEESITRPDTFSSNPGNVESYVHTNGQSTAQFLFRIEGINAATGGFRPTAAPARIGINALPDLGSTTGEHLKTVGVLGFSNTVPSSPSVVTARAFQWGALASGGVHMAKSSVARRFILEDLTVSQAAVAGAVAAGSSTLEAHTFVDQLARHQAIWNMRKASADYYLGDTWTAPGTLLP